MFYYYISRLTNQRKKCAILFILRRLIYWFVWKSIPIRHFFCFYVIYNFHWNKLFDLMFWLWYTSPEKKKLIINFKKYFLILIEIILNFFYVCICLLPLSTIYGDWVSFCFACNKLSVPRGVSVEDIRFIKTSYSAFFIRFSTYKL